MDAIPVFSLASSNVIMQISRLPAGRGVAESRVDSGRLELHPVKRLRTTVSYVVIAMHGTDEERTRLRNEINRVHAHVRARPTDPVAYNAFDPELQLWIAACMFKGVEDAYLWLYGTPDDTATLDALYHHCARFGTTLQVTEDMWPPDRAAFADYWNAGLEEIEIDEVTRDVMSRLVNLAFLPLPFRLTLGPVNRLFALGFLDERFRDELALPWSRRDQWTFQGLKRVAATTNRILPRPLRRLPMNLYLRDARRRLHNGRPVV